MLLPERRFLVYVLRYIFSSPESLLDGMNRFLRMLEITFRRDSETYRPRINKKDSVKDVEQKRNGQFFFLDE